MSEEKLGAKLTASIKKVRDSLKPLQEKSADAARKANSQSGLKWYCKQLAPTKITPAFFDLPQILYLPSDLLC